MSGPRRKDDVDTFSDRHAELDDGMRRTLERIAATAEARA
jgi:hypothetical protein